jgi:hypothetical protein
VTVFLGWLVWLAAVAVSFALGYLYRKWEDE